MGELTTIKDVFKESQTGLKGHGKLIKTLNKIYYKTEFLIFFAEFKRCLKYAMMIFKHEPVVERVIDFVAKFVPSLRMNEKGKGNSACKSKEQQENVADNKLLQELFNFLLSSHNATDRAVRFRTCQLINKLLINLGEAALIDHELFDRLHECMLERLKDKCPVVRYHAVLATCRLQDLTDENCPIIKAYMFLMTCDPNPHVRRAILTSIAPSTKTLASIVERTRDVNYTVRKTAYEVLSEKIHIKALSIALRLQLLKDGLHDRSEIVKQACTKKLLQSWLHAFDGNTLDLLRSLDAEDSTDICSQVLETLFKSMSVLDVIKRFDILDESLLVPVEQLSSETSLYWQIVYKYVHDMSMDGEEHKEKVMPSVVDFCAYVHRYVEDLMSVTDPEIQLSREFILEQLLLMTSHMDTADPTSRQAMDSLLHNMLMADHVSHRLVKSIIRRVCDLQGTTESLLPYFAEVVSDIREPITIVHRNIEAEQKRQINIKIAGIRVQLNQLREDLDTAVRNQDFTNAAELKLSISELDAEKVRLLKTTEPVREEVRTERTDHMTLLKCLTIIVEMLQVLNLSSISPILQMMIESQIVPGIQYEDGQVRNLAMQALALCCYMNRNLLATYIPIFMQASQIDVEFVRISAVQILFDVLLIYGLEVVDTREGTASKCSDNQNANITKEDASVVADSNGFQEIGTASKLVAIMCSFLDGESSELRTCGTEGLCKLLLSGRVVSSKILSHLMLLWYSPLSEDDTYLRDCLGIFFPMYALASRCNQQVVEEAFLPTLHTLLNAPSASPLAEVNVNNVAELLVYLTNTKLITQNQNQMEIDALDNPGHDNLSVTICNEILSKPKSNNVKLWVRILNQMEVSPHNEVVLKDLRILCFRMLKIVNEKSSLKGLQRFQSTITALVTKFISDNNDPQKIEIEKTNDTEIQCLNSQNLTMDIDFESELDITQDMSIETDAFCQMKCVVSDASSYKMTGKPSPLELKDDDFFSIHKDQEPDDNNTKSKRFDDEAGTQADHVIALSLDTAEESATIEQVGETSVKSPEKETRVSRFKNILKKADKKSVSMLPMKRHQVSVPSETPEKRSRLLERHLTGCPGSTEKHEESRSPHVLSGKHLTLRLHASIPLDKRKASQYLEREKKQVSKSPRKERDTFESDNSSHLEERASSKSPKKQTSTTMPRHTSANTRKLRKLTSKKLQQAIKKVPEKKTKSVKILLLSQKKIQDTTIRKDSKVVSKLPIVRNDKLAIKDAGNAALQTLGQLNVGNLVPRIVLTRIKFPICTTESPRTEKQYLEDKSSAQKSDKPVGVLRLSSPNLENTQEMKYLRVSQASVLGSHESHSSQSQSCVNVSVEDIPEHQVNNKQTRKDTPQQNQSALSRCFTRSFVETPLILSSTCSLQDKVEIDRSKSAPRKRPTCKNSATNIEFLSSNKAFKGPLKFSPLSVIQSSAKPGKTDMEKNRKVNSESSLSNPASVTSARTKNANSSKSVLSNISTKTSLIKGSSTPKSALTKANKEN